MLRAGALLESRTTVRAAVTEGPDRLSTVERPADERPYSPGLEGVLAGEISIALVDGANGRLLYRGYPIVELVRAGTYAQVAELLDR